MCGPSSTAPPPPVTALTLLQGGLVYTPKAIGISDILIGGTKILRIAPSIDVGPLRSITTVIPCAGTVVIPGIVDIHVHATGGGGEMGPYSRTPEAHFDQIVDAGTTTLVGLLGTDGVSRSLANALTKLRSFEELGLTTFMWSGNYRVPPPTLTGSYQTDIMFIDKIIGFGEIAIADHRSSAPTLEELSRLAADARVAGLLSGKSGVTYFHVGNGKDKIDQLFNILEQTDIPITQLLPTHMSDRGAALLEEGIKWLKIGGRIDFTADHDTNTTAHALILLKTSGLPLSNVSMSSDAYGSLPVFDAAGNLIKYDYQRPQVLYEMIRKMVLSFAWKLEEILPIVTRNPAVFLGLSKGELQEGRDADVVVMNERSLRIEYVYSNGEVLKTPTWTKPALFECV